MEKVLYVRMPKEIHMEIKKLAAFRYIPMERWALQAIVEKLTEEKKYFIDNKIP
jgi:hypothetical protein